MRRSISPRRATFWAATATCLLAAVLRLADLTRLGPAHDEVANWLIDRSILAGNHGVYFTAAYGHEAGFHYLQTVFVALVGDNVLALRLPAAFCGVLVVAVTFALNRTLYDRRVALIAAALIAVTFYPIFFSRLALRAISLPLLAGAGAVAFWRGWREPAGAARHFFSAGLLTGAAVYTYMASRAVPICYALFLLYSVLCQREEWRGARGRARRRGVLLFAGVALAVALPLIVYLRGVPDAEFRISEINAPLEALRRGNLRPILDNAWRIALAPLWRGDPLWRQNVAGQPIFNVLSGALFYVGVGLWLWRRRAADAFSLLWLAAASIPSLVTVDAPSTIRMIGSLPLLATPVAIAFVHISDRLSTAYPQLSTFLWSNSWIFLLTIALVSGMGRGVWLLHGVWPGGGDVPFVWQTALTEAARYLDEQTDAPATIVGWTPTTMDPPTLALTLRRDDIPLRFTGPATLVLPPSGPARVLRPDAPALPLAPALEAQLLAAGATVVDAGATVVYTVAADRLPPPIALGPDILLGDEWRWLGHSGCLPSADGATSCTLLTYWQLSAAPAAPRRLFVHVVDDDGAIVSQSDGLDVAYEQLQPGDRIVQHHVIDVSAGARLRLGVYEPATGVRLRAADGADAVDMPLPPRP